MKVSQKLDSSGWFLKGGLAGVVSRKIGAAKNAAQGSANQSSEGIPGSRGAKGKGPAGTQAGAPSKAGASSAGASGTGGGPSAGEPTPDGSFAGSWAWTPPQDGTVVTDGEVSDSADDVSDGWPDQSGGFGGDTWVNPIMKMLY